MRKIRIIFITKFVKGIHSYTGGMETHIDDLIKELKKDELYELSIITSKSPDGKSFEERDGVKIYYADESIGRNPLSRYKFFKSVVRKLKEIHYKEKFDLIHIQSDFGMGYFQYMKKKLPVISTVHGTTFNEFNGSIKAKPYLLPIWLIALPFYYLSEKNMLKSSDKVICVSDVVRNSLLSQYRFLPARKLKTILNGVDLNVFKKENNPKTKEIRNKFASKDDFLLLSGGNIIKQKGYNVIINAMPEIIKKNRKVKLVIVGDGDYLGELKKIVQKKKLENNVFFTGRIPREDLINYYSASNCFVFPTLRGEGLPYVLIEAMACGNVVLTTPNGGTDLVTRKNGALVNPKNQSEVIESVLKISSDKSFYKKILTQTKKDVKEKCDLGKMVRENKEIYEALLK